MLLVVVIAIVIVTFRWRAGHPHFVEIVQPNVPSINPTFEGVSTVTEHQYRVDGGLVTTFVNAAPHRQLYQVKLDSPGWVFWWHGDGTPGVVRWPFHFDHSSQNQNTELPIAVFPENPGAVTVEAIGVPHDAASKQHVLNLLHDAVTRPISAYQAHEIADMLAAAGPTNDPTIIAWLKGVAEGSTMLADVEATYPSKDYVDLYVVQRPPDDNHFQELQAKITVQYVAALGYVAAASAPSVAGTTQPNATDLAFLSLLRDPETAQPTIIDLLRAHTVPKGAAHCLSEAAIKDKKTRALTTADYIDRLDSDIYIKTLVELLVNPNPEVRKFAFSGRLNQPDRLKKVSHHRIIDLYNATTDPVIQKELREGVCIYVAPEITSRYMTDEFRQSSSLAPDPRVRFELAMAAAKAADAESLRKLLAAGLDPNQRYSQVLSLLDLATPTGNLETIQVLLKAGCDKPQLDGALALAVSYPRCVAALLAAGADPNSAPTNTHRSPLAAAAERGDVESVQLLLKAGANAEGITTGSKSVISRPSGKRVPPGPRPLELAAGSDLATVKLLIEAGADVNLPSASNYITPLRAAIAANNEPCARYLVENGAEVPKDASRALYECVSSPSLLRFLLEHGADPNTKPGLPDRLAHDRTPLIAAVKAGEVESVKALLEYGADADANLAGKGSARTLAQSDATMKAVFDHPPHVILRLAQRTIDKRLLHMFSRRAIR